MRDFSSSLTPPASSLVDAARQVRLAEIKRRIVEGTYETPALIEAAVEAFLHRDGHRDIGDIDSTGRPTRPK